ncbi:FkbM family methyltransferase [Cognatiyoonia sp. IB215446]|uniref:FkbM family methyltransferase n=1 Tax=Cognatiyoonia sp. IB215446 TaxID=3097355 RepID=UPI002A16A331|nr:FkbM family methyltransferase [Cognatiyoonia sp. IB215446]MDX8349414.1 FkbM family methyltransferase [Cognatiyoonia sp. IB215446]
MTQTVSRPAQSQTIALSRSFDVYYRDAERTQRMDRLNAQFVQPGSLAFDIGAHIGDRAGSFLRLGASVVVVEPQPRAFRALRLLYGRTDEVTLECAAVGAAPGTLDLFVNSDNPTITTASPDLIEAARGSAQWHGQVWDRKINVPVTTLDQLIARHGVPDFVKIDVEGFEADVLEGLTMPLPTLSFEFTTIQRDVASRCIDRLNALGDYMFNFSLGEEHALIYDDWIGADTLHCDLMRLPARANSGDIFVRRKY